MAEFAKPIIIPEFEGLYRNQVETIGKIRTKIQEGSTEIFVWGLPGTGKSVIEQKLRTLPGIVCLDPYGWERPEVKRSDITVTFSTVLPEWVSNGETPEGHIFHRSFSKDDLQNVWRDSRDSKTKYRFRTAEEMDDILVALADAGLGSTEFLRAVQQLPHSISVENKLAYLLACACKWCEPELMAQMVLSIPRPDSQDPPNLLSSVAQEIRSGRVDWHDSLSQYLTGEHIAGIEEIVLGRNTPTSISTQTADFYRNLPELAGRFSEPSFLLRSLRPLTIEEQCGVCEDLVPVFPVLLVDIHGYSNDRGWVRMHGGAIRKTALALYHGEDNLYCLTESSSDGTRLGFSGMCERGGVALPHGTLLYGGGDHNLEAKFSGASFALELILQKLRIPYEVARGKPFDPAFCFTYKDGEITTMEKGFFGDAA